MSVTIFPELSGSTRVGTAPLVGTPPVLIAGTPPETVSSWC